MIKNRIIVSKGIINSIEASEINEIISDGKSYKFPNSNIFPGMTDSHCHVWGLGMIHSGLDISGSFSKEETAKRALNNNFKRGEWIVGRGWNNELWQNSSIPDKSVLDDIFPDVPVALTRVDGHAVWCNSLALKIASISKNSMEPAGGLIVKNSDGEPTGILVDNAMILINDLIPEFSDEQLEMFILKGLDIAMNSGLTAVHDMDVSPRMINIYHKLNNENKLPIRVFAFVSCQNEEIFEFGIKPFISNMFCIKGIKLYSDGALGSYGAALIEEYADKSNEYGLKLMDDESMYLKVEKAVVSGFDVAIHAIGDAAVNQVLDVYQKIRTNYPQNKSNLRIEHSQIVKSESIQKFKELNVIASVQPIHFVSDSEMANKRLGEQRLINSAYLWKSFLNFGVLLIGGSDFPIESHNPFWGIDAYIKRQNKLPFSKELSKEILTKSEAFESYTINPYIALGVKNNGKITEGFVADLIITDETNEFEKIKIKCVIIDGKIVKKCD